MLKEFGMDYGVKPRMVLMADTSFAENFRKGKCQAIMYLPCPESQGNLITTELGFYFQIEEYADKFMDSLMRWVAESDDDGDAVELEFIEQINGEYLLAIAPNAIRFLKRMVPPMIESRIDPLFAMVTQGQGGMTIGDYYKSFKKQYIKGRRVLVRTFIGKDGKVEKVGERYFIKTEFKFSKEGELPHNSLGHGLLSKKDKPINRKNFKRKNPPNMEIIEDRRVEELRYFYPLSMAKIEKQSWLSQVIKCIPPHIKPPEILQAICNIITLERLKKSNPFEVNIEGPGSDLTVLQHLVKTIESFDSYFPPDEFFTKSLIKKQAKLDKQYLTSYLQKI